MRNTNGCNLAFGSLRKRNFVLVEQVLLKSDFLGGDAPHFGSLQQLREHGDVRSSQSVECPTISSPAEVSAPRRFVESAYSNPQDLRYALRYPIREAIESDGESPEDKIDRKTFWPSATTPSSIPIQISNACWFRRRLLQCSVNELTEILETHY